MLTPAYPAPIMTISLSWGNSGVVRSPSSGSDSTFQKGTVGLSTGKHGKESVEVMFKDRPLCIVWCLQSV